jgi:hypothetical protein
MAYSDKARASLNAQFKQGDYSYNLEIELEIEIAISIVVNLQCFSV